MLVTPLVLLVALAVVQIALVAHLRATLTSAAMEGARAAALAGSRASVGEQRTRMLLTSSVGIDVVDGVSAYPATVDGLRVMAVRIEASVPLMGLLGPRTLVVEGHALTEVLE